MVNKKKVEAGIKKAKEKFGDVTNKVTNSEIVKKMTPGQKFVSIGVVAILAILIVGLVGRFIFSPDVSVWGITEAPKTELSFKTDGVVSKVSVSEKQIVKKGEIIAQIDNQAHLAAWESARNKAMEANLVSLRMDERFKQGEVAAAETKLGAAEAEVKAAEAALELAKLYEGEFKALVEAGKLSASQHGVGVNALREVEDKLKSSVESVKSLRAELEKINTGFSEDEIAQAKSGAEAATAKADDAKAVLDGASIVAPFDSYIVRLEVAEGAAAVPGKPICEVADLSKLSIKCTIEASVARGIKIGAPVQVEFRAFSGEEFAGKVASLSGRELFIELDERNDKILPNMEAVVLFADN